MNLTLKSKALYEINQLIYYQDRVGNKEGYVKIYSNNNYIHERVKFQICYKLKEQGYKIYTECRFKDNQGRADLVAIKNGFGYIIEIMTSESDLKHKTFKYHHVFKLVELRTKNFKLEEFKI